MDVLCVGMYRACSTWQYEIAAELVEQRYGGRRLGYLTGAEYARLLKRERNRVNWRVIKSHEEHPAFTRALRHNDAIALYAIRDIRDVVYSMLHKRQVHFQSFLKEGMIHQILANDRYWRSFAGAGFLMQRYERILADPNQAVREIACALALDCEDSEVERLSTEYSLENNRKRVHEAAERLRRAGVDLEDRANSTLFDAHSLLHWNHLRSGQVGDWQGRASLAERRVFARLLNPWLARNGYEPDELSAGAARTMGQFWDEERDLLHGWVRCRLRCAALRYPRTGTLAKRILRIPDHVVDSGAASRPAPDASHGFAGAKG